MKPVYIFTILTTLVIFSSGCSDSSSGDYQQTVTIDEDQYFQVRFDDITELEWNVDYLDGEHNFDIYLMDEVNFNQFENGNSFNYIADLSLPDAKGGSRGPLSLTEDRYYLVIDNSDSGHATPPSDGENNPVRVHITAEYV